MCVWEGTQMHMSAQNVTGLIGKNYVIHVIKVWDHMISRWRKSIFEHLKSIIIKILSRLGIELS